MPPVLSMGGRRSVWLSVHWEPVSEWELSARTSCQQKEENYTHLHRLLHSDIRCLASALPNALWDLREQEERKCSVSRHMDSCQTSQNQSTCNLNMQISSATICSKFLQAPQNFSRPRTSKHSRQGVHFVLWLGSQHSPSCLSSQAVSAPSKMCIHCRLHSQPGFAMTKTKSKSWNSSMTAQTWYNFLY